MIHKLCRDIGLSGGQSTTHTIGIDSYLVPGPLFITQKATVDLAYPSNRFMFGYMIDDTPMLFVKKPGADVTMLNGHFEQGSFTLKDWNEWGFRVPTDKLGECNNKIRFTLMCNRYRNEKQSKITLKTDTDSPVMGLELQ